jgi:flagellin-like hook-associated protein FlgL
MISLNTNTTSLMASYHLRSSSANLQKSMNRLASGSRINSSFDDAGGLAVSLKLAASIRRTQATQANVNNTISFLQTQDGVLKAAEKVVSRMSELAVLARDVTKNTSDVGAYNTEFQSLQGQLSALSSEKFNGMSLFVAPPSGAVPAATAAQSIAVVTSADGLQTIGASAVAINSEPWMNMLINGFVSFADPSNSARRIFVPNEPQDVAGYMDTGEVVDLSQTTQVTQTYTHEYTIPGSDFTRVVNVNAHAPSSTAASTASVSATVLSDSANEGFAGIGSGGTFSWNRPSSENRVTTPTYENLADNIRTGDISFDPVLAGGTTSISTTITYIFDANQLGNYPSTAVARTGTLAQATEVYTGSRILNSWSGNQLSSTAANASDSELTQSTAEEFAIVAERAMQSLAQMRANNGAEQTRLTYAADVLQVNDANLQLANGKIVNVDIAAESARLARLSILQQGAMSIVAQANQSSQTLLRLLN